MKKLMLKEQYIKSDKPTGRYAYLVRYDYPYRRNNFCRSFSTTQERSYAMMHEIEYEEYNFKVRVRRTTGLPSSWDDLPSSLYEVEKCWKNNSRRRHQWIESDPESNFED